VIPLFSCYQHEPEVGVVTEFGEVYLVRKKGGCDNDRLYAMKVLDLHQRVICESFLIEREVHASVTDFPFLVALKYSFITEAKACLIVGEYFKNYSSFHIKKQSKQYNDRACRSV
jgi:serine/threonine protein kinase